MADSRPKRRDPRSLVTESTKKQKKLEYDLQYAKTRIYLGNNSSRWHRLKETERIRSDPELAKLLLDSYEGKIAGASGHRKTSTDEVGWPNSKMTTDTESPDHHITTTRLSSPETTLSATSETACQSWPAVSHMGLELSEYEPHILSESGPGQSTPKWDPQQLPIFSESDIVSISSSVSGVHPHSNVVKKKRKGSATHVQNRKRCKSAKVQRESFMDPFDFTIDVSTEELDISQKEDSDEDYEVSFDITIMPNKCENLETMTVGDIEFGDGSKDKDEIETDDDEEMGPGIQRVLTQDEAPIITEDNCFLVYLKPLMMLAKKHVPSTCPVKGCGTAVSISHHVVGSAIYLKWECDFGHLVYRWCSQAVMYRRLHAGDLMLATASLLSGNNFSKVAMMAKFLKLQFLNQSKYDKIQSHYLVPAIEEFWQHQQDLLTTELSGDDLVILGDGRMDSPGHSAQYCTYTAMDNNTKKIVNMVVLDKRETDNKSGNLEKAGFTKTMEDLNSKGLIVTEVVTDAHTQIGAVMKRSFPDVKHSHDIWHAAKNLGKKIIGESQTKANRPLKDWAKDIVNHFWYVSKTTDTYMDFVGSWCGILHHVVDEHTWTVPYTDSGVTNCSHGPLTTEGDRRYLEKGTEAHVTLRKLVLYKRFLNKIPYYLNFRSTAELENFHQLILMYASKRFAYTPPVYRARNYLAALDYNAHVDREIQKNKDGSIRYHRIYNKKSARWTVKPYKVEKTYPHIQGLIDLIVRKRIEDRVGMSKTKPLDIKDPRRISAVLAPIPPPPTAQLVEEKKSRL